MSLLVRHKGTGQYLRGHDEWTLDEQDALHFNSGLKLIDYIEHGGVHEKPDAMEIVVCPSLMAQGQRPNSLSAGAFPRA